MNHTKRSELKETLHQYEQSIFADPDLTTVIGSATGLYEEGQQILRTLDSLTSGQHEFDAKSKQAYWHGLELLTLSSLIPRSLEAKKSRLELEALLADQCQHRLAAYLNKNVKAMNAEFKQLEQAEQMLADLADLFKIMCHDDRYDYPLACLDECYVYALKQYVTLHPKQTVTVSMLPISEQTMGCITLFCRFFERKHPAFRELIFGLPAEVAYQVGLNYYQGRILPLDHQLAQLWLAYAVIIGHPQARLAYLLFFDGLNFFETGPLTVFLGKIKGIYLLTAALRDGKIAFRPCNLTYFNLKGQQDFCLDMLCNYARLVLRMLEYGAERFDYDLENELCMVMEELVDRAVAHRDNLTLKALLAEVYSRCDPVTAQYLRLLLVDGEIIPPPGREVSDDEIIEQILGQGLEEKDYDSLLAYCRFHRYKPKNIKYLKLLAEQGDAEALYVYGCYLWEKKGPSHGSKALSQWTAAADEGHGIALLNLVVEHGEKGHVSQAKHYARLALESGNMLGFYVLYRLCLPENPALAYTYLRYAAVYLFPRAIEELEQARLNGNYRPLPYMRTIDELESLAQTNGHAAVVMSSLFLGGGLMPHDLFMVIHWMRKAISLGEVAIYDELMGFYNNLMRGSHEYFYLRPVFAELQEPIMYNMSHLSDSTAPHAQDERVERLIHKLFNQLKAGKTDLEHELLLRVLKDTSDSDSELARMLHRSAKPEGSSYYQGVERWLQLITETLIDGDLSLTRDPLFYSEERMEKLTEAFEMMNYQVDDQRANASAVRAISSIRSATLPFNLGRFYRAVALGANGHDEFCWFMRGQNFNVLEQQTSGAEMLPQVEQEHVFIAGVSQ